MTTHNDHPPLPEPHPYGYIARTEYLFSANQLHTYARQAVAEALAGREVAAIATDDDVQRLALRCGWDNRKYMTPAYYSEWCQRMRMFATLAHPAAQPAETCQKTQLAPDRKQPSGHDARREVGKWLNEEATAPIDRVALAQLCAAFDALASQPAAAPEGWQLVPVEPAAGMVDAGVEHENWSSYLTVREIYSAMLAAAPSFKGGV